MSSEAKADLQVWLTFLSSFNGVYFFRNKIWENSVKLLTQPALLGSVRFLAMLGAMGDGQISGYIITSLFLSFFLSSSVYACGATKYINHSILFFTDNEVLVHVINKQSCHDKVLMVFVRKLVLVCLEYNILFKAKHIPGTQNIFADSLSRLQVQTFKQLAPSEMNPFPKDIPLHFQPLSWAIITHLTKSSLQPSIPTYVRAWKLFTQFHRILFQTACFTLLISPTTTALFIAYLFERNYTSSTVNTYLSALSCSHKHAGLPDPTRVFYIIQMLKGYSKNRAHLDSRLPIKLPILQRLMEVSPRLGGSNYQRCQFKAMCSLAFFAF